MKKSSSPVAFIMPNQGIEEWDKPGQPAHDPEGLKAFLDEIRKTVIKPMDYHEIDAHINDQKFADKALEILDHWIETGLVKNNV